MNSKSVLFAIGTLSGGGAERVVSVWANQLAEIGYKVSVVVYGRTDNEYAFSRNVSIYSCADSIDGYLKIPYYKRYLYFRKILRNVSPDYVIPFLRSMRAWMFFSCIGFRCRRIDTMRISPWCEEKYTSRLGRIINNLSFATSYKIIIQAAEQRQWFSRWNRKKTVLIPNPIEDKYLNIPLRAVPDNVKEFIAVGRLAPQKNYPMMIEGFAKVVNKYPDITLKIFGDGPDEYKRVLQELINKYEMRSHIYLMGRTAEIDVEYSRSHVFVMTSDFEGSPNALIEAMASRLICVSTDCRTGPKELITHAENGFLIPVGSTELFANTICQIIEMDKYDREGMSELARKRIISSHSKEKSLERLCSIFVSECNDKVN